MKLSVKWQAVFTLSVILFFVTCASLLQFMMGQEEGFKSQAEEQHHQHEILISAVIEDSVNHLSEVGQLIGDLHLSDFDSSDSNAYVALKRSLESQWMNYRITNELVYLGVWRPFYSNLSFFELTDEENSAVQSKISLVSNLSLKVNEPRSFVFCFESCLVFAAVPYVNNIGEESTVVVARDVSGLVRRFHEFSQSYLGILVAPKNGEVMPVESPRYLPNWGLNIWALSQFSDNAPVLKAFSERVKLDSIETEGIFGFGGRNYAVHLLETKKLFEGRSSIRFVSISDKTASYQLMMDSVVSMTLFGIGFFIVCIILLYFFVGYSVSHLQVIVDALLLLPKKRFSEALSLVPNRPRLVDDELSLLEKSTAYVTGELRNLHDEIDAKSLILQEQILALNNSRAFMSRLFDNADVFIITQKIDGEIFTVNKRASYLGDLIGARFVSLISNPEELSLFSRRLEHLKNRKVESFYQEAGLVSERLGSLVVRWTHTLVDDEKGEQIILSIGMDYTKQKSAEDNLRWLANHDSLTGLGNRRSFNESLLKLIDTQTPCGIVFVDVNKFKVINDIYGHGAGDCVLIDIAEQVTNTLNEPASAFRLAGDEFTILLAEESCTRLQSVLIELSKALERTVITYDAKHIYYSVSMGVAMYPDHGESLEDLMVNADMAMYHAKKKGHGSWHIFDKDDDHAAKIKDETKLLVDLRMAISNCSFSLVYQPILNMKNNEACHYEALIRMSDFSGRTVSPVRFIPLAEKFGEIRAIDEWVIDKVLEDLHSYSSIDSKLSFSVNVSAPTLQSNDFPAMVFHKIFSHHVQPSRVVIEVTETAYIENFEQVLRNLKELASHGVKVALDDFGVGFSSFNYLKQLPLTYVKLDGSYVKNLTCNKDDQVFVKSLSAMISAFEMQTIAEFVEDEATLVMLRNLGVHFAQGYFISRPKPIGEFMSVFSAN